MRVWAAKIATFVPMWKFLFNRHGFGRTSWMTFTIIATMVGLMAWYALCSGSDDVLARVVVGGFAVSITAIMIHGTIKNYNETKRENGH